jgi:transcriptional regulator GlxA family with amidase domain
MTFVISHQGRLVEKDLGPDTARMVAEMAEYDPDRSWKPAQP